MDFDEAVSVHSHWKRELRCILVKGECSLRPADAACACRTTWLFDGSSYVTAESAPSLVAPLQSCPIACAEACPQPTIAADLPQSLSDPAPYKSIRERRTRNSARHCEHSVRHAVGEDGRDVIAHHQPIL